MTRGIVIWPNGKRLLWMSNSCKHIGVSGISFKTLFLPLGMFWPITGSPPTPRSQSLTSHIQKWWKRIDHWLSSSPWIWVSPKITSFLSRSALSLVLVNISVLFLAKTHVLEMFCFVSECLLLPAKQRVVFSYWLLLWSSECLVTALTPIAMIPNAVAFYKTFII